MHGLAYLNQAINHSASFWTRKIKDSYSYAVTFVEIILLFCTTMTWLIIIGILTLALIYLLVAPIYLLISTPESRYEAGLTGIFKIWLNTKTEGLPELYGRFFFIERKIKLQLSKGKPKSPTTIRKRIRRLFKRRVVLSRSKIRFFLQLSWKLLRSFKLKQLKVNIDTGDVIHNAHLIPVFTMAYHDNIQLSVNYEDENEFILHFENKLGTIIIHIISAFIKHKLNK